MATPEKLNLWDRIFNRYRYAVHNRGHEEWKTFGPLGTHRYFRAYVEYIVTDRLTGSERIKKEYLNNAEYDRY